MQFKRGAPERRIPELEEHEDPMSNESNTPAQETRSPFSYSRQGGGDGQQRAADERAAPAPGHAGAIESVVDSGAVVDGHFQADNDLRIQGTVSGEITCRGNLTIERTATAKARIHTQECEVHGTVDGDITCSGRLQLAATAVVNATIHAGSLVVEEGASITGSVETGYTGEVTSAASGRRRSNRKDDDARDEAADDEEQSGGRKGAAARAGRDAPSFALVSSDDSASSSGRESRSS